MRGSRSTRPRRVASSTAPTRCAARGTLREIAEAAVFLASPAASFMNGEVMTVDGGGRLWGELWTAGRPAYFDDPVPRDDVSAQPP